MTQPQNQNPSPLHSLLAQHLDLVYSAALRQTRDPHLAEDITQTVFLLAAKKHRSIPPTHTAAWLINATRYTSLATLRAHRRRARHEHRAATENPPMPPASPNPELTDLPTHLDAALSSLPPSDRELLIRRYFQNLPIADIAAALHLSDNALSKRLARALEKLRHHLARKGITAPAATLTATLISTAIRPAPKSLAAHILSNAALTPATPFGVLLMTIPAKLLAFLTALLLLASTLTAIVAMRPNTPPTLTPTIPIAAPAPTSAPASPEQKTEALHALDQCRQSLALLKTASFSYTNPSDDDSRVQGKRHSTDAADIRRDARGWWFADYSNSFDSDASPLNGNKPLHQKTTILISFLNGQLLTKQSTQVQGRPPLPSSISIWPKANASLRALGTLGDGVVLEGYLMEDTPHTADADATFPTYLDILQSEFSSLSTQSDKTLLLTSHGPHGLYQLTLDPNHHFLPARLEVTKSNTDLYQGEPLNSLPGRSLNGLFPDATCTKARLLLNNIHFQSFPQGDVIDAAELAEDYTFDNDQSVTRHATIKRTNIHLNPKFTESDFHLPVPDGTPVTIINRDRSRAPYPTLEYRNGQILRVSDHQPPTEEQSTAPEK